MDTSSMMHTIEEVVMAVTNAQREHLRRGRVERTFTTDLAKALGRVFETDEITVDPFYNKHEGASKRLTGKLIELDIAIHERGVDRKNLVAIELETSNAPSRDDIWKLEGLTQPLGSYGYALGLFLAVGVGSRAGDVIALEWYVGGQRV